MKRGEAKPVLTFFDIATGGIECFNSRVIVALARLLESFHLTKKQRKRDAMTWTYVSPSDFVHGAACPYIPAGILYLEVEPHQ